MATIVLTPEQASQLDQALERAITQASDEPDLIHETDGPWPDDLQGERRLLILVRQALGAGRLERTAGSVALSLELEPRQHADHPAGTCSPLCEACEQNLQAPLRDGSAKGAL